MEFPRLEKEYTVHVYETGPDGRLNLYSLFDYFQDIASDHAVKLGYGRDELMKKNNFWVLSRIYSEISTWPLWGETIIIRTWPRGTERLFALRDFEVRDADGKTIARATSSWLIVDMETRRIRKPDSELSKYNTMLSVDKALPRNAIKLEPADSNGRRSQQFSVRISDLDINLHTNNARYLKWVTDSYDLDFTLNNVPLSAEINYLAESRFNDFIAIVISREKENSNEFNHSIMRISDNTEICRLRIKWKNNQTK
jgi:medium-chain acyl-[acyl-carrier-protein] hydrolase